MWNAETAQRLNAWYLSPAGAFALVQENRMFQSLVSPWPRRGHTLLDVGCGTGVFLDMFWQHGFDVTGFDNNVEALDAARVRLGNKADFQLGQADHLPFDDKTFDYAALLSVLEYFKNPQEVLAEAIRVSERGVIVGFLNRFSAYALLETCASR
ncbi:MAG: class I SAM-dependent methyltransferase, partial [Bilophila sp.]